MDSCLFCQIIAGKIPCYKVYEDRDFLAFLDINPLNPGHTLVIPKKHYRWITDVKKFREYWSVVGRIAQKIKKIFKPESVAMIVWGYEVLHAHIHLLPRYPNDGLTGLIDWSNRKKLNQEKMGEIALKLKETKNHF